MRPPAVILEKRMDDFEDIYENRLENWNIDGHSVVVYRDRKGIINAAIREGDTMNVFLAGLDEGASVFFFHDLFGYDGFTVRYSGETGPPYLRHHCGLLPLHRGRCPCYHSPYPQRV